MTRSEFDAHEWRNGDWIVLTPGDIELPVEEVNFAIGTVTAKVLGIGGDFYYEDIKRIVYKGIVRTDAERKRMEEILNQISGVQSEITIAEGQLKEVIDEACDIDGEYELRKALMSLSAAKTHLNDAAKKVKAAKGETGA